MKDLMEGHKFRGSCYYRIACSCGDHNHDIELAFYRQGDNFIELDVAYPFIAIDQYWMEQTWQRRLWHAIKWRIKNVVLILFTGQIHTTGNFVLDHENLQALKEAIKQTEEHLLKGNDDGK